MAQKLTLKVYPDGYGRSAYRVFEVSDQMTLEQLCRTILGAFSFDDDHLFAFYMDNNVRYSQAVYDYEGWDCANRKVKTKLSRFNLVKGQKFVLHYDFGDDWIFRINVKNVEDSDIVKTRLIKSVGYVDQYPNYED